MNLFVLNIKCGKYRGHGWDLFWGFVIASENAKEARKIANGESQKAQGNEQKWDLKTGEIWNYRKNNNIWLKPEFTETKKIGIASKGIKKGVIFSNYQEG